MTTLRLTSTVTVTAEAGEEPTSSRTIEGIAVPYGITANASTGPVMFLEGSLPTDGPAPKLFLNHDPTKAVGLVTERTDTPEGMRFRARISATQLGDEALTLALDGVIDAVSIGVELVEAENIDGTTVVAAANWLELSMTPTPAFAGATIDKVAATTATEPETPNPTEPNPTESEEEPTMPTDDVIPTAPLTMSRRNRQPITAGRYLRELISTDGLSPDVRAVVAEESVSDILGAVPELIVGSIFDTLTDARPLVSALSTLSMPAGGATFTRRKVTQHTLVGQQLAEFDELASQAYQVDPITVTKKWFGGTLNLSEQAVAYADVNIIDAIVTDMAREYARTTEVYTATQLMAVAGAATAPIVDWTDGDEVVTDLYAAAAEIKTGFGEMPTHLVISSSVWAKIGAAKDSSGSRIFPYLAPSNAAGTLNGATSQTGNPLGLQLVISDDLGAGDQAVMLNRRAIELYEDRRGALQAQNPSNLSLTLAFRGVFAVADIAATTGALILV